MNQLLRILHQDFSIALHNWRNAGAFRYHDLTLKIPSKIKRSIRHQIVTGKYEQSEFDLVTKWLRPDLPAIELGGCLGIVSAHLRATLNTDQKLTVVEANPNLIEICRVNATHPRPDSPTEVINAALAYGTSEVPFHINRNAHISRLAKIGIEPNFMCPAVTLGDLVAKFDTKTDYCLVCDIEGAELDLFRNDQEALRHCAVAIVELHPHILEQNNTNVDELLELASAAGLQKVTQIDNVAVFQSKNHT